MAPWLNQRLAAIRVCLDSSFADAALALLYSAIDTLAFLGAPASTQCSTKPDFIAWCDRYIVPSLGATGGTTGIDLYGARCGVLHTSSAASALGQQGKAREVWYQFEGRIGVNMMANTPQPALLLDMEILVSTFSKGSRAFLADLEGDQPRLATAQQRAQQFFSWGVRL
jgi:hypothetical protein